MLYFDYTATTPIDKEVLDAYVKVQQDFFGNTNSLHKLGQESNLLLEKAIGEIHDILDFNHKLIFTGSASEANNLAIFGIVKKYSSGNIITTKIEHPSVYEVYKQLEQEGFNVKYLDVDETGIINMEQLESYLNKDTVLVSVMWVNNVVGSIQPIANINKLLKKYPRAKFHVDAVQGLGKLEDDFDYKNIDLLTFSAHKLYGPKGIGLLCVKDNIELKKILYGSAGQNDVRPGTINLAAIVAFCKGIKKYIPTMRNRIEYVKTLNTNIRNEVKDIPGLVINSDNNCSPYIFNISFPGTAGETIVNMLSAEGIYVSTGSACSQKLRKKDRVLYSMFGSEQIATSSIRISISELTKDKDIDILCASLRKASNLCMI